MKRRRARLNEETEPPVEGPTPDPDWASLKARLLGLDE